MDRLSNRAIGFGGTLIIYNSFVLVNAFDKIIFAFTLAKLILPWYNHSGFQDISRLKPKLSLRRNCQ